MRKRPGFLNKFRHIIEYAFLVIFAFPVRFLSARQVFDLGQTVGKIAHLLSGKRRRIGLTNLDIAFGDSKSAQEKRAILKKSVIQLAVTTLQCLWLRHDTEARVRELVEGEPKGLEVLKTCLNRQKGVFFLTAHYGNWELMGLHHGYMGIGKLNSIARHLDNPYLEKVAIDFRTLSGNGIFYRDDSPLKMARAIKNNECVAVMMDQNTAIGGVFVDFFGKKAATANSVARLRHKMEAAVVPLFSYPTGKGTYTIEYGPELALEKSGDKESDILAWTQECGKFIESVIRERPENWMWEHRRWKTRPPGQPPIY